ncbi:MAG: GntR family transcriptional regulator [Eubacteriales bacterium]
MLSDFENNSGGFPLAVNLLNSLRNDILSQKIKTGEKLLEQRICNEYKVSRTPVREAFIQLELEGLLENIPNRGAFATGFSKQDIEDIFHLRKSYEKVALKWAIERITDEELESLNEAYEFMEFYTKRRDYQKIMNINAKFHELIYKATKNRIIYQTLMKYHSYIKPGKEGVNNNADYLDSVLLEHKNIYESIAGKDLPAGTIAIEKHIDNLKRRYAILNP